jgi:catechol 2,3-dioxygenase-like lactoylglutathione lyase family enzyme
MMAERTIPILPCRSIDATLEFYAHLGFEVAYRQERPNTYAAIVRGGIELQFFVLKPLEPDANWSTCYVVVDDVDRLYEAMTEGLRAATGKVATRGYPRIGALRDMSYGVRQFVVVDPSGNHIRIGQPIDVRPAATPAKASRLERTLTAAVTLADSKGDAAAAAAALDSAFAADPPVEGEVAYRALVLRADLAHRLDLPDEARAWLDRAAGVDVLQDQLAATADERRRAGELAEALG